MLLLIFLARTHQENRPSLYTPPLTGQALSVPRPDVGQRSDLGMGK